MPIGTDPGFNQDSTPNQAPTSTVLPASSTAAVTSGTGGGKVFGLTSGWYVFFGVGGGVLLSNTRVAPVILAILSSALLYQISQLIEGK